MEENATSILDKIKKVVFGEEIKAEEVTEVTETVEEVAEEKAAFMDATLEDGTLLNIEPAFEVGAAVVVIDADGNVTPAEDATHTLASGEMFVTVDGVITEIVEAAEEEEAEVIEEVPMAEDQTESKAQEVKKVVESIIKESHFAKIEELAAQKEEFATMLTEAKNEIKEIVFEAFTKFSEQPIKEPTTKVKPSFSQTKKKNIFTNLKSK